MWNYIETSFGLFFLAQGNITNNQIFSNTTDLIASVSQIITTLLVLYKSEKHPLRNAAIAAFLSVVAIGLLSVLLPQLQVSLSFATLVLILIWGFISYGAYFLWNLRNRYAYDNPPLTVTKAYERHLRAAINSLPQVNDTGIILRAVRTVFKGIEEVVLQDANGAKFDITLLKPLENGHFKVIEQSNSLTAYEKKIIEEQFKWSPKPEGVAGHVADRKETALIGDLSVKTDRKRYDWLPVIPTDHDAPQGSLLVMPILDLIDDDGCIAVLSITCSQKNGLSEEHKKKIALLFADKLATLTLLDTFIRKHL